MTDDMTQTETTSVGILAYGSLISDPGAEIEAVTIRVIKNVETPFCVEFARSSESRKGAPTLIPVGSGGRKVNGHIIVVNASTEEARDMLYRREIHKVGSGRLYKEPLDGAEGRVRVKLVDDGMEGVGQFSTLTSTPTLLTLPPHDLLLWQSQVFAMRRQERTALIT